MRLRFFVTIFLLLSSISIAVVGIHSYFLKNHHLELVDAEANDVVDDLLASELNSTAPLTSDQIRKILSDKLGTERIGKFFVVRNRQNQVLYENASAYDLTLENIPSKESFSKIEKGNSFIRYKTLKLPKSDGRSIQIGVVVDHDLLDGHLEPSIFVLLVTIFIIGAVLSLAGSQYLMAPIANLQAFLSSASQSQDSMLPSVPQSLSSSSVRKPDEFTKLIEGLNELIAKVNRTHKYTKQWSYQMAHEIKTPLALMQIHLENFTKEHPTDANVPSFSSELLKIKETVFSFLSWAELENSSRKNLFANNLNGIVKSEVDRLPEAIRDRVKLNFSDDKTVVCDPHHLQQLVFNLLSNALRYSSKEKPVAVKIIDSKFIISDHGDGIPREILEKLGEPFNLKRSVSNAGHGLGLAWVKTICRIYNWTLDIKSNDSGTTVAIDFGSQKISS